MRERERVCVCAGWGGSLLEPAEERPVDLGGFDQFWPFQFLACIISQISPRLSRTGRSYINGNEILICVSILINDRLLLFMLRSMTWGG